MASFLAIASKFVIRWRNKHLFYPTNFALVGVLASSLAWISAGQWGQVAWFGFLIVCLGSLVVTRAARADVTLSFIGFYVGLLMARALWLGDPLTIPLHQIESGTLLIFSFFMITDPKTTPDSRTGRILFTCMVALIALFVQFGLFRPNGTLRGLIACSPLVPLVDHLFPCSRYDWSRPSAGQTPMLLAVPLHHRHGGSHDTSACAHTEPCSRVCVPGAITPRPFAAFTLERPTQNYSTRRPKWPSRATTTRP